MVISRKYKKLALALNPYSIIKRSTMKVAIAFLFLTVFVAVSMAQGPGTSPSHARGQPDCNDPFEFTRLWRNNFDPNSHFRCDTQGVPATLVRCNAAFIESAQRCGTWDEWEWRTPFDPPNHN